MECLETQVATLSVIN